MSAPRTWVNQFGLEYAVPAEVLKHPGIIDTSWGNDASPSFTLPRYQRDGDYPTRILWVEHPDRLKREFEGWNRFLVSGGVDQDTDLYNGDDIHAALAALERGAA